MYNGKHLQHGKYSRKRTNKRKATVLLSSLVLLVVMLVGTTAAFLIASDGPITNIFNPSNVSCQVNEESFDGTTKTNVTIANTGDTEAYIRAAIVVTWKDAENGNVYAGKPVAGTDYTITLNTTDWFQSDDGFYYFRKPVAAGDSTDVLIQSCVAVKSNTPVGYGLNVEILGSAIQSVPTNVVTDKWGVTVDADGTLRE